MTTASSRHAVPMRIATTAAAALVLCLALAGCQPEPSPSASVSASPSASASASPDPSSTPTQTAAAGEEIALPTACDQLYSPTMFAALQQRDTLNDPGVTMTSTQNVEGLEILSSGVPTIRCTWGVPSETGMATNVTIVDSAQSAAIAEALIGSGFACEDIDGGTVCRYQQTMVTLDDDLVELTETHVLRGNVWISTATIDFEVEGYTEDIIATLWG